MIRRYVLLLLWRNKFSPVNILSHHVHSRDANDSIIKAMYELQDFVLKAYKNILKQRSIKFYFKKKNEIRLTNMNYCLQLVF